MGGAPTLADLAARCSFPPTGSPIDLAVSGGPDSLALLVLAAEAGLVATAHVVDHALRPDSADAVDVVRAAGERHGVAVRAHSAPIADGPDLEARARDARRALLGPDVATGHTADDQAETVLFRLVRGTGPEGLAAMRHGVRHPLLALRRADTERVCALAGLEPVRDPANHDPRFARNRLRHEVLPLLGEILDRDPVPQLVRAAELSGAYADLAVEAAAELDPTDVAALRAVAPVVASIALRRWLAETGDGYPPSAAELDRVVAVVEHRAVATELAGGRRVSRHRNRLRVEAVNR